MRHFQHGRGDRIRASQPVNHPCRAISKMVLASAADGQKEVVWELNGADDDQHLPQ